MQPDVFVVPIAGTSNSNYAELTCTSNAGNVVSVAFRTPVGPQPPVRWRLSADLFRHAVAADLAVRGSSLRFDPATGVNSYSVTTETFTVSLGEFTSEESQKVNGNLTGRPSGICSSSIIVTVTLQ